MTVTTDPRVDAYIEKAAEFARPILTELRERVHKACPDVVETIKWGMPSFEHHGFLGGIAGFKKHCSMMFWQEKALNTEGGELQEVVEQCGKITALSDLPGKMAFKRTVRAAMAMNEAGKKRVTKKPKVAAKQAVPKEFAAALAKDKSAKAHFDKFAPGYKRDYIEWIADAKRDATREKRIKQAIEWLREGKHKNWKYENC